MQVYWAALATAAFYALHVPVCFAFQLSAGNENRLRVGVGVFEAPALWRATIDLNAETVLAAIGRPRKREPRKIGWKPAVRHALGHLRVESASFSLRLGTDDAARTALLCGAAQAAAQTLKTAAVPALRISISPIFDRREFALKAKGILSMSIGHIIATMALLGIDTIKRRKTDGESSD